tara:strand:- start:1842 stop:2753 length:912 start_codon:yes stop_codon:yes gene_type:complete
MSSKQGMLETSLKQIKDNPQVEQYMEETISSTINNMANGMNLQNLSKDTQNAINFGETPDRETNISSLRNNVYGTQLNNLYDNNAFTIEAVEDSIYDYILNNINPNVDTKKIFSNNIIHSNILDTGLEMYYYNLKKLKNIRDDISYNIVNARLFYNKLENYTNTNPNLHLLSKTKDKLQNKIDSYEKHMNIDSKMNKELEINIKNNKNYNYYLIIIHYVILILFFIFSNFMKNKYYKNPVATIMIILYIIAPFIIKYILLYIYKFYLYIMKKYNLLNTGLTYEDIVKYDSYNYENNQENISYV